MNSFFGYLIIFVVVISIFHFVYEGIILPSIRLYFRNRLFILRDKLRSIYINEKNNIDHESFNLIHDSLSSLISRLHYLSVSVIVDIQKEYTTNPEFRKKIARREMLIEKCKHEEINSIIREVNGIVKKTIIANCGAWFIYLIPIAICVHSIKLLSQIAKEIVVIPESDANRLIPDTSNYAYGTNH